MVKYLEYILVIKTLHGIRFNTNIVLIWILIPEDYGWDIEYTQGDKNKLAGTLSIYPLNGNGDTTQKSTYKVGNCARNQLH